ncbi:putative mitogen-activated protein kinase kinase kinase STE-STE11 family [Helianthus annuus]|nr:putative mitogen-activated protein kinase kinase kinase STE-STE11 family [Helianthus annuus]KAJ0601483.1 putative mitogen-activated protein kinase kinase kinase STE-STE11 family [Helianthus annuus]KAJ0768636.1 putative mitogen-activated protein kinase kinase kinase STE-STE11 family [Helianthus annuus]KAJ0774381.1 putative mitogen-activated protein kinase kinase kinase STE-STE11 family [Helianthus annuus]KAJ0936331.1 putative mitogen-activated protein kinase kinase kinase STE-STE11 family [He
MLCSYLYISITHISSAHNHSLQSHTLQPSLSTMEWKRGPIIGRGSSATVSVATTSSGNLFAVKSTDLSTSQFLQKEQHFLSQLSSKNIIKYMGFDINYHNNKPTYNLFMEYATGGTISDMIKKLGGSLDECLIRFYTHQVLLGLDYLHNNNIVHCDIKCQNLLICEEGVKIGDLGCAKFAENDVGKRDFKFSGTPVFMAPEVARGEEQGFPADVWALGCSVIEMATGFNAWPEVNDPVSGLYRIGYSGEVPEIPKCLPEDGKDFLAKCLKKDAKERWIVKELLQHPFVRSLNLSCETRDSPTSILDQGFWESLPVSDASPVVTRVVGLSGEGPVERIRQLVEATPSSSGLPDWDDEDEWITVRSNRNEEMNVEYGDFMFSDSNVDDVEEIESLVVDEDYMSLEYSSSSRVLDFDHIIISNKELFCK